VTTPFSAENEGAQGTTEATTSPETAVQAARPERRAEDAEPVKTPAEDTVAEDVEDVEEVEEVEDVAEAATQATAPVSADAERDYQKAYLLRQLQEAHGGSLPKGKANRFPRLVQRELSLTPATANALREELIQEGYVTTARKGGTLTYEITEAGRAHLKTLSHKPMSGDRKAAETEVSEEVRKYRRTFLLFQLFEAEGQTLEQKVINRFREPGRTFLDLRAPAANEVRKTLQQEGLITITRQGKSVTYRLTEAGQEELGATAHFPDVELTIQGRVLNELLEAARESAKQFEAPTHRASPSASEVGQEQPVLG
jgi:DNA-binding PadR family transcriptional regulator